MSIHNNAKGINQHKECPHKDDPAVTKLLRDYHRRNIHDKKKISNLLLTEHGFRISATTVKRRQTALGLQGSRTAVKVLTAEDRRQLVLDQMRKDPTGRMGVRTVKRGIAADASIHLTWDAIVKEMRAIDPEGFESRQKKKYRGSNSTQSAPQASTSASALASTSNLNLEVPDNAQAYGDLFETTLIDVDGADYSIHGHDQQEEGEFVPPASIVYNTTHAPIIEREQKVFYSADQIAHYRLCFDAMISVASSTDGVDKQLDQVLRTIFIDVERGAASISKGLQ